MTNDRPPSSFEPPHPIFSTWVGVVLLFALFALIALVIVAASPRGDHYEKTRAKARAEKLKTATDETNKSLTTYAWVDKTKGIARIPINDAMRLTLADLSQKKPAPGSPIVPAEAQNTGTQAAAPATPAPAAPLAGSSPSASATPKVTAVTGPNSENRGQPAAATNPAPVQPGTQPGGAATPAASPPAAAAQPGRAVVTPSPSAPGTPLPIRGKRP